MIFGVLCTPLKNVPKIDQSTFQCWNFNKSIHEIHEHGSIMPALQRGVIRHATHRLDNHTSLFGCKRNFNQKYGLRRISIRQCARTGFKVWYYKLDSSINDWLIIVV